MLECPSRDALSGLFAPDADPTEAAVIALHVDSCVTCQAILETLTDASSLPAPAPRADEPALASLLQRLQADRVSTAPRQLGALRIDAELGRGGMGIVYRGFDEALRRTVAVKVLRAEFADPEGRARFLREARAAAAVSHESVTRVQAVFDPTDAAPYLVMEFVDGPTLHAHVRTSGVPDPRRAAEWLAQVADGVAAAHAAGLVHRDIKPGNVLIDRTTDRAKVTDFGLARVTGAATVLTARGDLLGTPGYMSPEQVTDADRADARSDVYGLGATLYEALTGAEPFRGSVAAVLEQVRTRDPLPPRVVNEAVPLELETICPKAMTKEPGGRYATAAEFADDLRRWLRGEPVRARPVGAIGTAWRWCRRNPRVATLAGSLALVILASVVSLSVLWRKAEANAEHAREQERQANEARARSDERGLLALDTINTLVFKAQQLTGDRPGTLKLRQQLSEAALADLAKLAASAEAVPGSDRTAIAARLKLGEAFQLLGKTDDARRHFTKARELAEARRAEFPDDPTTVRDLGNVFARLGRLNRGTGAPAETDTLFQKARDLLAEAALHNPTDAELGRELATAHTGLGDLWSTIDAAKATPFYADARAVLERFQAPPEDRRVLSDLRYVRARLGQVHAYVFDFPAADTHYAEAERLAAALVKADPDNMTWRRDRVMGVVNRGDMRSRMMDYAGAEQLLREAIRELDALAKADPDNSAAKRDLAVGHSLLGVALSGAGRHSEGRDALARSLVLREEIAALSPASPATVFDIYPICLLLLLVEHRMERYDAAGKWMDRVGEPVRRLAAEKKLPPAQQQFLLAELDLTRAVAPIAAKAVEDPVVIAAQPPDVARRLLALRAVTLARRGRHADADGAAEQLRKQSSQDVIAMMHVALAYGLCVKAAPESARYRAAGLAALAEVQRIYPAAYQDWHVHPELDPFRTTPEYTHLVRQATKR